MPREPDPSWQDGMRSVRRDEFGQLSDLFDTVFWPGLVEKYPHMYIPENAANLRVVVSDGQVVSHIGAHRRNAAIMGCTVRVASVGGVATLEAHRGKGYATALLGDTMRDCREDGVDFMVVSGYRKMYYRHGCRRVGRDWNYTVTAERAGDFDEGGVDVAPAKKADMPAIAAIYRREPVRWMRPISDFENALVGYVMNRPAHVLAIREQGALRGYVMLQQPGERDGRRVQVQEFAGDRRCVVGALGKLIRAYELEAVGLHAMGYDSLLRDMLEARGLTGGPANASGSVTLIHFTQFMERMRPYFAELVGDTASRGLIFHTRGDEFVFSYGGDEVVAEGRGDAVQLIFGTHEGAEEHMLKTGGRAGELLREIFPIPALWYGVNYV